MKTALRLHLSVNKAIFIIIKAQRWHIKCMERQNDRDGSMSKMAERVKSMFQGKWGIGKLLYNKTMIRCKWPED